MVKFAMVGGMVKGFSTLLALPCCTAVNLRAEKSTVSTNLDHVRSAMLLRLKSFCHLHVANHHFLSGQGWLLYGPNNWYDGTWREDKLEGKGTRQFNPTTKYKGGWKQGDLHGHGTMIWDNKDVNLLLGLITPY